VEVELRRPRGAVVAVVAEVGPLEEGPPPERDSPALMVRIRPRILRTTPQPLRSALAEPAVEEPS